MSVFIGNLPLNMQVEDLRGEFKKLGNCTFNYFVRPRQGGFAFAEYEDVRDAEKAVKEFDGLILQGSVITVEITERFRRPLQSLYAREQLRMRSRSPVQHLRGFVKDTEADRQPPVQALEAAKAALRVEIKAPKVTALEVVKDPEPKALEVVRAPEPKAHEVVKAPPKALEVIKASEVKTSEVLEETKLKAPSQLTVRSATSLRSSIEDIPTKRVTNPRKASQPESSEHSSSSSAESYESAEADQVQLNTPVHKQRSAESNSHYLRSSVRSDHRPDTPSSSKKPSADLAVKTDETSEEDQIVAEDGTIFDVIEETKKGLRVSCTVCDIKIKSKSIPAHLRSRNHIKKVAIKLE
jgi:RNA recognition motif-containing protein